MDALETFLNFGIAMPVDSMKVVITTTASPGNTSRVIGTFFYIKDSTDIVDLEKGGVCMMYRLRSQRDIHSVSSCEH